MEVFSLSSLLLHIITSAAVNLMNDSLIVNS